MRNQFAFYNLSSGDVGGTTGGTYGGGGSGGGGGTPVVVRAGNVTANVTSEAGNVTPETGITPGEEQEIGGQEETPQREILENRYIFIGMIIVFVIGIIVVGYLIVMNVRKRKENVAV